MLKDGGSNREEENMAKKDIGLMMSQCKLPTGRSFKEKI
jgi:hypothetical protein